MKRIIRTIAAALALLTVLTSCSAVTSSKNLMKGVTSSGVEATSPPSAGKIAYFDFALQFLRESGNIGDNVLISPLSIYNALAMLTGGAGGSTKAQLEQALGMSDAQLCDFVLWYRTFSAESKSLRIANAAWFREGVDVGDSFLQKNADYYGADLYSSAFDDKTVRDINGWVKKKTDGMIEEILNRVLQDELAVLINAVAFEAQWKKQYSESGTRDHTFTGASGDSYEVPMMFSQESIYLEGNSMTGYIKPYLDERYAFAALLPDEGLALEDVLFDLSGEQLAALLLSGAHSTKVDAGLPRFTADFAVSAGSILKAMGITDAFDSVAADFSGIVNSGPLWISDVFHKTHIEVDESGTKAAAATSGSTTSSAPNSDTPPRVILDRPFLYMILDMNTGRPIFIGVVGEISH